MGEKEKGVQTVLWKVASSTVLEDRQPFSHLCLDYGVLRRPPESNCRTATRIQAPMKAMITLPQK